MGTAFRRTPRPPRRPRLPGGRLRDQQPQGSLQAGAPRASPRSSRCSAEPCGPRAGKASSLRAGEAEGWLSRGHPPSSSSPPLRVGPSTLQIGLGILQLARGGQPLPRMRPPSGRRLPTTVLVAIAAGVGLFLLTGWPVLGIAGGFLASLSWPWGSPAESSSVSAGRRSAAPGRPHSHAPPWPRSTSSWPWPSVQPRGWAKAWRLPPCSLRPALPSARTRQGVGLRPPGFRRSRLRTGARTPSRPNLASTWLARVRASGGSPRLNAAAPCTGGTSRISTAWRTRVSSTPERR